MWQWQMEKPRHFLMKSLKGSQPQELSDELQVKLMIRGEVHLSLE